jgi:hypothetical protein
MFRTSPAHPFRATGFAGTAVSRFIARSFTVQPMPQYSLPFSTHRSSLPKLGLYSRATKVRKYGLESG